MNIQLAYCQEMDDRREFLACYSEEKAHGYRRSFEEYYSSRLALRRCLLAEKISLRPKALEIVNYHHLSSHPHCVVSLSHTRLKNSLCVAVAALGKDSDYCSLGVDIEWGKRSLPLGPLRRILHPEDTPYLGSLELWVMKEAAYKALWPLVEEKMALQFSKISIQGDRLDFAQENIQGIVHLKTFVIDQRPCRVAVATIAQLPKPVELRTL